ncbi:MAG TPA: SGNH/GDSL hydrolase family protein [Nitrospira sp.]|nr:SGNH/GDSL hydrolase family protein [Nitrospira sp.]
MGKHLGRLLSTALCCVLLAACGGVKERPIQFIYLALGASDATGVGALPLTEGYVYLIARELDRQIHGVFVLNLGVPGARIDLVKEQARVAKQLGTKTDVVTLWTGPNDVVNGDDPKTFQDQLRGLLGIVKENISPTIVVANVPDLTMLPRFRTSPNPSVTVARIDAFNRAIAEETRAAGGALVDLHASPVRDELVFDVDGFHPNNAGHREIARQFLQVLLPKVLRR